MNMESAKNQNGRFQTLNEPGPSTSGRNPKSHADLVEVTVHHEVFLQIQIVTSYKIMCSS